MPRIAGCPWTNDLIEDGVYGNLVPVGGRAASPSLAFEQLMGDNGLRARLAAEGPKVTDRYSPDLFVSQWEALLSALAPSPE